MEEGGEVGLEWRRVEGEGEREGGGLRLLAAAYQRLPVWRFSHKFGASFKYACWENIHKLQDTVYTQKPFEST